MILDHEVLTEEPLDELLNIAPDDYDEEATTGQYAYV
jgi:hypothetical protein